LCLASRRLSWGGALRTRGRRKEPGGLLRRFAPRNDVAGGEAGSLLANLRCTRF
jgi:hypothetical protein